ncbi:MAG: glycosyltransferase [Chloroflexi bacterium]|nr:glycosyltransferase [Chloroflexota bacterium]
MSAPTPHILFLTPQVPYPPEQGTTLRNYNILRLASRHARVSLLCLGAPASGLAPELTNLCQQVLVVPEPPARSKWQRLLTLAASKRADVAQRLYTADMQERLNSLLCSGNYDALQVEGIELAGYVLGLPAEIQVPIIFDDQNAEFQLQARAAQVAWRQERNLAKALYSAVQSHRLRKLEHVVCTRADVVTVCSQEDAATLQRLDSSIRTVVLPNGIDTHLITPGSTPAPLQHPAVVFTGKMDYRPNLDGISWFSSEIWPLVRQVLPEAQLYIVGQRPLPEVQALHGQAGITVTGRVPEVLPYLAAADCIIAPLRIGGGTRLKLLEAMAAGKPIVATALAAEGLHAESGAHLLLAEEPAAFAQAILAILNDRTLAESLGSQARAFVSQHYEWDRLEPHLLEVYTQIPNLIMRA